mgnify:CR=1 FL=1
MKFKKIAAFALAAIMSVSALAGCGTKTDNGDKVYKIGLCQLVQHPALDAATNGFM